MYPNYTRRERLIDSCIHCVGIIFSLMASAVMLGSANNSPAVNVVALAIYCFGMVAMFVCSACYNLSQEAPHKEIFRRFDHAAIYVMIAGSYTPLALVKIGGTTGTALLATVWTITVLGVVMKFRFPRRFEIASIVFYLTQGWTILFALGPLMSTVSDFGVWLLGAGGVIYTIGVGFHLSKQLPFHNAIWHGFVLIAASCHYAAIYREIIPLS